MPDLEKIKKWYSGEVVRSIGFYINPYKLLDQAKFRHIFSLDGNYNLYIAQHSIYQKHIEEIFDLKDKREYGLVYPKDSAIKPDGYQDSQVPIVEFECHEEKNIVYFNKRLKPICQRLLDYGCVPETKIISKKVDLWYLTIKMVLKGQYLEKPI